MKKINIIAKYIDHETYQNIVLTNRLYYDIISKYNEISANYFNNKIMNLIENSYYIPLNKYCLDYLVNNKNYKFNKNFVVKFIGRYVAPNHRVYGIYNLNEKPLSCRGEFLVRVHSFLNIFTHNNNLMQQIFQIINMKNYIKDH
jgi:hypothetical protein